MIDKPNPLTGMFFYDSYNGTVGTIGHYLGAGFYLERLDDRNSEYGQKIYNLGNLLRSGRFFHDAQQRDKWMNENSPQSKWCAPIEPEREGERE